MNKRNMLVSILFIFLSFTLVSCNSSGGGSDEIGAVLIIEPPASGSTKDGLCYSDQYATPADSITRKLDILIVIDTSGSIIDERDNIAKGFDHFINQLPEEVDYQFGVLLGHGDRSSWSGKLYKKGTEPIVLSSDELTKEEIISALRVKMNRPQTDYETDGGEVGLYSLMQLLSTDKLEASKEAGFFRDDAALAVVFVADEQDICAEFPAGVVPVADPQGKEDSSFDKYCINSDNQYIISPEKTLARLQEFQDDKPLVVGGVIYKSNDTIVLKGENEIGYGYKETIEQSAGLIIDMANGDYTDGLKNLGVLATTNVKPINDFSLKANKIDESTLKITVDNVSVPFTYDSALNIAHLTNERDDFSVANVSYCELPEKEKLVKQLVSGGNHNCVLLTSGEVRCWGANNAGQLGLGHTNNIGDDELPSSAPAVDLGAQALELSAGYAHTCAVLVDGDVKCWGENIRGQLGQGNTENIGDDELPSSIPAISLPSGAVKIYSGTRYNCALLDNAKISCWGENMFGQLGYGHANNIGDDELPSSAGYVSVGDDVVKMDISTISFHSCAVLKSSGDMKCWGYNNAGQLGYGHTNNIGDDELPSSVASISFSEQILQLSTGFRHSCALVGGQKLRCWGENSFGQIGTGNAQSIGDDEEANSIDVLNIGVNVSMVRSGNYHNCLITNTEDVHCFGQGSNGALGLGNTNNIGDDESLPSNTGVNLGIKVNTLAAGIGHTCAVTSDEGNVICWGQGSSGQLGYGNTNIIGDDEDPSGLISIK